MRKNIATIDLDNEEGRGIVFTELGESDYYENTEQVYIIRVELPNGEIEEPAISPQRTMVDVEKAINASWGSWPWDLEWIEE